MAAHSDEHKRSALKAWVRALERTAPIGRDPHRTLPVVIEALAAHAGARPALIGSGEAFTYHSLTEAMHRCARWGLAQGLGPEDLVALYMENRPEYLALWLGLTSIGITVALVNSQLRGEPLRHCLDSVRPRYVICSAALAAALLELPARCAPWSTWAYGAGEHTLPRLELELPQHDAGPLHAREGHRPLLTQRALCIYTSGTTGLPKAANVSHYRLLQWSHWFAGLMDVTPADRMYDCLPLYHSVGGVVATGAALVSGASVVVRERFSARSFWADVHASGCTLFQYIGELCRYLLAAPPHPAEQAHALRLACGNGLRAELWERFQQRFRIAQILEYYAATEGNFSLYNCEARVGAVGRIPPFLAHRAPVALVRFDPERALPRRTAAGRCERCATGEVGEALGQVLASQGPTHFEGYTDPAASAAKLLHDVFEPGDTWYRTGDLMRQDAQGFFYFVDRVGDTFRWKGENVSTTEVAAVIARYPGVLEVAVYGVTVPGHDGRAGMAALVSDESLELAGLQQHLARELPGYARPVFLRRVAGLTRTGTFKLAKQALLQEGYDPGRTTDPLYVWPAGAAGYEPLDAARHAQLEGGALRL